MLLDHIPGEPAVRHDWVSMIDLWFLFLLDHIPCEPAVTHPPPLSPLEMLGEG